jgi:hypothetical protein
VRGTFPVAERFFSETGPSAGAHARRSGAKPQSAAPALFACDREGGVPRAAAPPNPSAEGPWDQAADRPTRPARSPNGTRWSDSPESGGRLQPCCLPPGQTPGPVSVDLYYIACPEYGSVISLRASIPGLSYRGVRGSLATSRYT